MMLLTYNQSRYEYALKALKNAKELVANSANPSDWLKSQVDHWQTIAQDLKPLADADDKAQADFLEKYKGGIWATVSFKGGE